jgi:hypothetical protein
MVSLALTPTLLRSLTVLTAIATTPASAADPAPDFQTLAPGLAYAAVPGPPPSGPGEAVLHLVRVDPEQVEVVAHFSSEKGNQPRSASDWCDEKNLAVAMNLGMYMTDYRTNVGYARKGTQINSRRVNHYQSYLVLGPRKPGLRPVDILDADDPATKALLGQYDVVVQNLRLIRGQGQSVWKAGTRPWAEAAVAVDDRGRVLFVFSGTPMSAAELIHRLLALPLGIQRAAHADGGPPASLSIHTPALHLDLNGSFETGINATKSVWQMPLPNILGVVAPVPPEPADAGSPDDGGAPAAN